MLLRVGWCAARASTRAASVSRHHAFAQRGFHSTCITHASSSNNSNDSNNDHKIATQLDPHAIGASKHLASTFLVTPSSNSDWQVIHKEHFEAIPTPKGWDQELDALEARINVRFRDRTHLLCALTHHGAFAHNQVAAAIDDPTVPIQRLSNRSLEFLGDSLLGFAVASHVFQTQPRHQEGQLTQAKGALVNNAALAYICEHDLALHRLVRVASDYSLTRQSSAPMYQKGRTTIQAGAVEALIAAVYLDQGLATALAFVNDIILPAARRYATHARVFEPIGALQTLLQAHGFGHPVYKHLRAPLQSTTFYVALVVKNKVILTESGPSYKAARVKAADAGFQHFTAQFSNGNDNDTE